MLAVVLENGSVRLEQNRAVPQRPAGWSLIRITRAGICRTDLELAQGYMGFQGVPGHEFCGVVTETDSPGLPGRRVVGEINAACGTCPACKKKLGRHCPNRTVLGILGLDGCMAEYCILPDENLLEIPAGLTDDDAVFCEPVSAACEILDQLDPSGFDNVLVLGDGKLGILCAWVLAMNHPRVTLAGRHPKKLKRAIFQGLETCLSSELKDRRFDLVVDATGRGAGFAEAMQRCLPRGTIVLKSTVAAQGDLNLAPIVIDELTVIGSRCGRFEAGLPLLTSGKLPVNRLVDATYPLAQAPDAFAHAGRKGAMKVLFNITSG